ncbi:phenylalanine--tRNA ligase subunit beta [Fulvivirgaceae bacterium BMA10]|uniref:Phenylalanine--tRNA ligase beta subunit n=1 Tax=Splendidivirga corallicola TaxID=3051826 RepID=A0ABT8KJA4_9BACT|nr:phenylalanine--tRNA ligase subunit beta [Fulvivirgaceae bacterium BMA10]
MKISLNWLGDYIDVQDKTPEEVSELLTQTGLEVEGIEKFEQIEGGLNGLVIGEVLTCDKHPDADKLSVTTVDVGNGSSLPIVCGAPNVAAGQKVIVATVGTTLYPSGGDPFKIKKAKIRGAVSEGMICAEDEIGIGESHDGIMVLETDFKPGTPASDYFELKPDYILEIGLTPNRADAASHIGTARDLKAVLERPISLPSVEDFTIDNNDLKIDVSVEDANGCPRYSALTISNVTIAESPEWLKNKLRSIGLAPINNAVDSTNFILHELGQPLHAFDANQVKGKKVIVKTLPAGSKFVTLDEKERKLEPNDLMICNEEEGMCIAGVFGGTKSGVTEKTKNIFLESAYFSPDYVRKTAMHHGLKTDASFRYERGTDPNITVYALKRAAILIKEICGGKISSDIIDIYPEPIKDFEVDVTYKNINRLIGKKLDKKTIRAILEQLDISIGHESEEGFKAIIPPYRVDVQREADVIEEILRIYGFNNVEIPEHFGADFLSDFPKIDKEKLQQSVSELLAGSGFSEIITNSLTSPSYAEHSSHLKENENVVVLNKLSEDLEVLRQTLVFSGLEVISHNQNRRQRNLKLFEFGTNYFKRKDAYEEEKRLAIFMTGDAQDENWINKARQLEFYDLSSIVHKILDKFKIKSYGSTPIHDDLFSYGLDLSVEEKTVVRFGKLAQKISDQTNITEGVFYADFDWEYLLRLSETETLYQEISKFPEVRRDLSLVINKGISFDDIKKITERKENWLLREVSVFDVYEGERLGDDKKAYALKFILQDQNKTLTDKVIDKTMKRLMHSFENELGAIIRK